MTGVTVAQFFPWLLLHSRMHSLSAAWGWSTTPKCVPASGANWAFAEGFEVNAGTAGSIRCSAAGAAASVTAVLCPSSTGLSPPDNGWWEPCGGGGKVPCAHAREIGNDIMCEDGVPTPAPTPSPIPVPSSTQANVPTPAPTSSIPAPNSTQTDNPAPAPTPSSIPASSVVQADAADAKHAEAVVALFVGAVTSAGLA
eukprot:TRINITY_DN47389_c0_g1_i1.p1 TRINITY_DN47389_c0_g1~~TRINITY_DN47389_c0_g1_i1.p1  ORF type:complete len:220 (-),score=19.39 TRINITY_DN47389_c0_g1_i1:187-780(-)